MCKELCDHPDNPNGEMQSCPDCGCLICFDVQNGDDVIRPAFVTSSGDLFCDLCGSSHERADDEEAEDEDDCGCDPDDDYPDEVCNVCGAATIWECCWQCGGEGGFHDCGEDCCPCLHPELDLNDACDICHGRGGYHVCVSLPHTEEQLSEYQKRKEPR